MGKADVSIATKLSMVMRVRQRTEVPGLELLLESHGCGWGDVEVLGELSEAAADRINENRSASER